MQIAAELDRSPKAIRMQRIRLGLRWQQEPPVTPAGAAVLGDPWAPQDDTLRALWAAGTPVRSIAALLGRTVDAVQMRRQRLGLPARQSAWPVAQAGVPMGF